MICKCGKENRDGANFCAECGAKLVEVCDCWVKKEPYNCGQAECPGYRLFLLEKRAEQSQANLALDDLATEID